MLKLFYLISILFITSVICLKDCQLSDFGSTYTDCDNQGNRRVAWFKLNECKEGNVTLPSSSKTFSCSLACQNGHYLKTPSTECKECLAGTYSFTSGIIITNWTEDSVEFPSSLKTSCTGVKCSKWELHGHYIDSGDQHEQDGIVSTLEFTADIIRDDGKVVFFYKVDAERIFDGLSFYVNGHLVLPKVSQTYGYKEAEFKLNQGVNKLAWVYSKDGENTRGRDRAYIKAVKVYGTKLTSSDCLNCPKGSFSLNKAENCTECEPNFYNDIVGSTSCKACPEGTYSLHHGSTTCIPRPACTTKDFYHHFTDCSEQSKRNKLFEWNEPKICAGGVSIPANQNDLPCAPCPEGSYRTATSKGKCITCTEEGSYYNEQKSACDTCPKGTMPIRVKRFESFSSKSLPEGWTSKCIGLCPKDTHKGFQVTTHGDTNHLVSGVGEITELEFQVELDTRGRVLIDYKIENDDHENKHSAVLLFLVNSQVKGQLYKNDEQDKYVLYTSEYFKPGVYPIKLTFEKYQSRDKKARVLIKSITVEGEKTGGASRCNPCPAGFECSKVAYKAEECPPGSYSKEGEENCSLCPLNTFTHDKGRSECEKCGTGTTTSKLGSVLCDNSCVFEFDPLVGSNGEKITYDLRGLKDKYIGPIRVYNTSHYIYFNICGKIQGDVCKARGEGYLQTYSCLSNKFGYTVDIGSIVSFKPISDDTKDKGFIVDLREGSLCKENKPRLKTEILFKCNPEAGRGTPILDMAPPTHYLCDWNPVRFIWESAIACPVCTKSKIKSATSECKDGKKVTSYFYERPQSCYEADKSLIPEKIEHPCRSCESGDYYYVDTKCISGKYQRHFVLKEDKGIPICEGGVKTPPNAEYTCSDLTLGWKTATIITASVLVLILTLSVAFLVVCRSHQQLKYKYTVLQERSDDDELDDLDSLFSDEEDEKNAPSKTEDGKVEKRSKKSKKTTENSSEQKEQTKEPIKKE